MRRRELLTGSAAVLGSAAALPALGADAGADLNFGRDFVWGASTSSYQIEGATDEDGRGPSIWDVFSRTSGRIRNGDTGDVACDHYHRSREDVALLARGGFSAYRFSVAWPRVLPEGTGAVNARGLDFYDRLVDDLLARATRRGSASITGTCRRRCRSAAAGSIATAQAGSPTTRASSRRGSATASSTGPCSTKATCTHCSGTESAPTHQDFTGLPTMLAAQHHQNLAQGLALKALRAERGDLRLGTVMSLQPVRPVSSHEEDGAAAARFDALWNRACIDPLVLGRYPDLLADDLAGIVKGDDLAATRASVDFLGLNFYSPMHIAAAPGTVTGAWFGALPAGMPVTHMGWPIAPDGLLTQLRELRDDYGNPDIHITENGAAFDDVVEADGAVRDPLRIAYLGAHLQAARQALREGVKLRGYFVWSLLDNFEWEQGYSRRFGVVHVDFATLRRTPKASFHWMADVIRTQG